MTNSFTPFFFRTSGWSLIIGLTISLAAVNNTINNNRVALNLEQYPVVTDPLAIFRCPVCELFHIASQLVCHGFDFVENTWLLRKLTNCISATPAALNRYLAA